MGAREGGRGRMGSMFPCPHVVLFRVFVFIIFLFVAYASVGVFRFIRHNVFCIVMER